MFGIVASGPCINLSGSLQEKVKLVALHCNHFCHSLLTVPILAIGAVLCIGLDPGGDGNAAGLPCVKRQPDREARSVRTPTSGVLFGFHDLLCASPAECLHRIRCERLS